MQNSGTATGIVLFNQNTKTVSSKYVVCDTARATWLQYITEMYQHCWENLNLLHKCIILIHSWVWKLQAHFKYAGIFYFVFLQYYFLH